MGGHQPFIPYQKGGGVSGGTNPVFIPYPMELQKRAVRILLECFLV